MNIEGRLDRVSLLVERHGAAIFFFWSVWLTFWYFGLGPRSFVVVHDTGDGNLPYRIALAAKLMNDQWGYWDPQKLLGIDSLTMLVWPFQPDVILLAILPQWLAYGLMTFLQRFLAGYFTFRLLRESLSLPGWASLYSGLVYSLYFQPEINGHWAGFTLDNGFLCEAGLPFFLWCLSRLDCRRISSYWCSAGLGIIFSLTAWMVNAIYLLPMFFFWRLVVPGKPTGRDFLIPAVFAAAWVVASLPFLAALFSNVGLSHRAHWNVLAVAGDLTNQSLVTYVYEKLLFGLRLASDNGVPLALGLAGLLVSRGRSRSLVTVLAAAAACIAFQPLYGLIKVVAVEHLGFLRAVNFDRIYLLAPFLFAVAGGLGLSLHPEKILGFESSVSHRRASVTRSCFALIPILLVLAQSCVVNARILYLAGHGHNFVSLYRNPQLAMLAKETEGLLPFRVATVAAGAQHPSLAWVYGFETADGYINVYSSRYQAYWEQIIAPLVSTDQWFRDYFHNWGSRVYLFSPSFGGGSAAGRPTGSSGWQFREWYNLNLLALANVKYIISASPLRDEDLALISSGVSGAVLGRSREPAAKRVLDYLRGSQRVPDLYVYENRLALPRFFMVTGVRFFDETSELLRALGTAGISDLRSTAFLLRSDEVPLGILHQDTSRADVKILAYRPDRIHLRAVCGSDCILIATNNFSPFWKATVNNQPARIFPVDHCFQGIPLNSGESVIELNYDPPYAKLFSKDLQ